jgi:hypothetical protein
VNTLKALLIVAVLGITPWLVETSLTHLWLLPVLAVAAVVAVIKAPAF